MDLASVVIRVPKNEMVTDSKDYLGEKMLRELKFSQKTYTRHVASGFHKSVLISVPKREGVTNCYDYYTISLQFHMRQSTTQILCKDFTVRQKPSYEVRSWFQERMRSEKGCVENAL